MEDKKNQERKPTAFQPKQGSIGAEMVRRMIEACERKEERR